MRTCPACNHRWRDKYGFDECPHCLCQISKAIEQHVLITSTARNMEPIWSLSSAQKMKRWSNTLRDTIHQGRTPRHNPTIPTSSPNPKFQHAKQQAIGKQKPSPSSKEMKPTPLVSPTSESSIGTPSLERTNGTPGTAYGGLLPRSYMMTIQAAKTETKAELAKVEAQQAKAEAEEAKATAAEALAEVARLRTLLEQQRVVPVS